MSPFYIMTDDEIKDHAQRFSRSPKRRDD